MSKPRKTWTETLAELAEAARKQYDPSLNAPDPRDARIAELEAQLAEMTEARDEQERGRLLHEGVEDSWRRACMEAREQLAAAQAEVERLRGEVKRLDGLEKYAAEGVRQQKTINVALRARCETAEGALREAEDCLATVHDDLLIFLYEHEDELPRRQGGALTKIQDYAGAATDEARAALAALDKNTRPERRQGEESPVVAEGAVEASHAARPVTPGTPAAGPTPAGSEAGTHDFENEICDLINRYSVENMSDTPDFILARYVAASLDAFASAVRAREHWYGRVALNPQTEDSDGK